MSIPGDVDWQRLAKSVSILAEEVERNFSGRELLTSRPSFLGDMQYYYRFRRKRDELFGEGLFADPAWDMLLDLYIAKLKGELVSTSSLCVASAVPSTTALRWIGLLEEKGLIRRTSDKFDRRRVFVQITDEALTPMSLLFDRHSR